MPAERGRQHLKPLRRAPEMQFVGGGEEAAKLMQVHAPGPRAGDYIKNLYKPATIEPAVPRS
jgi:hypothetical protein